MCENAVYRPQSPFHSSVAALRIDQLRYPNGMLVFLRRPIVLMIVCLIASGMLIGQSRNELKRAYGEPISETFAVRPGIQVTATYSADVVTELIIAPRTDGTPELVKSRGDGLSRDFVNAIIDELVPLAVRGKYVIGGFANLTCLPANDCNGSTRTYEKVTIYYNAAPEGRVFYAVVKWNDKRVPLPISR